MFITIEGIDGTGKTTQAKLLAEYLETSSKEKPILTKEPGGWTGGEELRQMVISGELLHPWSEAYLFMLDRAEHVSRVITPAINAGQSVVCERYHDSTLAYQVWGRGLPLEPFDRLFELSAFPVPDMKILLDLEPEEAMKRVKGRGMPDAFEKQGTEFMSKIRSGYLFLLGREPERWIKVSALPGTEDVFAEIIKGIKDKGLL